MLTMKREQRELTENMMWEAAKMCDANYDGIFYYAVKSTGIFCRPSCRSKTPLRYNVAFFTTAKQAIAAGYRPCKRCRPELAERRYDPAGEVVSDVQMIINTEYAHVHSLKEVAHKVGVSPFHLQRLFKQYKGMTPKEYLDRVRIQKAIELLEHSSLNNVEIGYATGFQSISSFYNTFRKQTGTTPTGYKQTGRDEHGAGV